LLTVARTLWITGLSGAGKSTLSQALSVRMAQHGTAHHCLDGDVLRQGLCADLGFSSADRSENVRRVAEMARLLNDAGAWVIASLVSPSAADRARARQIIGAPRFALVWARAPLAVCEARDPKGLYAKARQGTLPMLTGIDAPYDDATDAWLVLDTGTTTAAESARVLCRACGFGEEEEALGPPTPAMRL
jgi:adenylylsulfate kinase